MTYLPAYADELASVAADLLVEVSGVLETPDLPTSARARLVTVQRTLPTVVNGLDWLSASIALAGQVLHRGPEVLTPTARLQARLADLAAVRGAENAPACSEQTGAPTPATHPLPEGTEAL